LWQLTLKNNKKKKLISQIFVIAAKLRLTILERYLKKLQYGLLLLLLFCIGEYTIIIPSFTKSKYKNEASLLVLFGFVGLLHS